MTQTAAIVGTGLVGRSWAIAFARGGWSVRLWDADPDAAARAREIIDSQLADLEDAGLLHDQSAADVAPRITDRTDLADALAGVDWVQESAPEDVDVKRELWSRMARAADETTVLASSTSAIVASLFTEDVAGRERCLVAHPINPPHLVPAVEIVPAPWTSETAVRRAGDVMRDIGRVPVSLRREIVGFVVNRLQGALLEEAFRLVADGVCGPDDVDAALRDGLALRWSFMGPFETIDLNAPGGVRDYAARYQPLYENMFASMQRRVDWTGPVMDEIEAAQRARVDTAGLAGRQRWRDRRLMALLRHKDDAERQYGE